MRAADFLFRHFWFRHDGSLVLGLRPFCFEAAPAFANGQEELPAYGVMTP